jgi:hypothetical protein
LPALTASCQAGAVGRIGSPPGGSTCTTLAPSRRSSRDANGPWQVPGEIDDERAVQRSHPSTMGEL